MTRARAPHDTASVQVLDWDFLKMDRVIGVVKVSAEQLVQESEEAKAKAGHAGASTSTELVLHKSSSSRQDAEASSAAFKNPPLSSGCKKPASQSAFKDALSRNHKSLSPYNSSLVAFKGEMECRKSGCITFKVFSPSG